MSNCLTLPDLHPLTLEVLRHLPIRSLLDFGLTSMNKQLSSHAPYPSYVLVYSIRDLAVWPLSWKQQQTGAASTACR